MDAYFADIGPIGGEDGCIAWHEMPLPACPDCGGDLVWWEAGYVPGTRKCLGHEVLAGKYDPNGGCGSLFSVQCQDGRVVVRRVGR